MDGASKGNPRPVGSGGVLLDYSGRIVLNFAWGLGQKTNNFAEMLAIWQGLNQARSLSIKKLVIIGDSSIIIQDFKQKKIPTNMELAHYFRKVSFQLKDFDEVQFYHVLRKLNHNADHEANVGASKSKGALQVNGIESHMPIP